MSFLLCLFPCHSTILCQFSGLAYQLPVCVCFSLIEVMKVFEWGEISFPIWDKLFILFLKQTLASQKKQAIATPSGQLKTFVIYLSLVVTGIIWNLDQNGTLTPISANHKILVHSIFMFSFLIQNYSVPIMILFFSFN